SSRHGQLHLGIRCRAGRNSLVGPGNAGAKVHSVGLRPSERFRAPRKNRQRQIPGRPARGGCLWYAIVAVVLFVAVRWLCSWAIDYQWWKEMGQLRTWFSILAYSLIPTTGATIIAFIVFWIA